jgi:hypothetical protein
MVPWQESAATLRYNDWTIPATNEADNKQVKTEFDCWGQRFYIALLHRQQMWHPGGFQLRGNIT